MTTQLLQSGTPAGVQDVKAYNDARVPFRRLGVVVVLCAADGALAGLSSIRQSCCLHKSRGGDGGVMSGVAVGRRRTSLAICLSLFN